MGSIVDLKRSPWTVLAPSASTRRLLILPLGPIEEHGPHLPLGTDLLLSERWARDLSERLAHRHDDLQVLLYPGLPIAYGDIPLSSGTRGCFHVSTATVRAVVGELLCAAAASGVDSTLVLSAHADPRHQIALEHACADATAKTSMVAMSPAGALFSAAQLSLELSTGPRSAEAFAKAPADFHAGWIETSLMLAMDPSLVASVYVDLPPVDISARDMANPQIVAERTKGRGWLGSPALASAEAGHELFTRAVDFLELAATTLVERGDWQRYGRHYLHGKGFFPQD